MSFSSILYVSLFQLSFQNKNVVGLAQSYSLGWSLLWDSTRLWKQLFRLSLFFKLWLVRGEFYLGFLCFCCGKCFLIKNLLDLISHI
uniref:Putative pectin methyltransferase QUA2 n=1 Tax=Rhizophora mucronata TaxID=61149 RepID=A0A2P2M5N6_RHIMU